MRAYIEIFFGHNITWAKDQNSQPVLSFGRQQKMVLRSLQPSAKSSGIGSEKRMAHYPSTPILLCVGLMHLMLFLLWVALPQPNLSRPVQLAVKMNIIKRYLFDRN